MMRFLIFVIPVLLICFCVLDAKTNVGWAQNNGEAGQNSTLFNSDGDDSKAKKRPLFFNRIFNSGKKAPAPTNSRSTSRVFKQPQRAAKSSGSSDLGALLRASDQEVHARIQADAARTARKIEQQTAARYARLAAMEQEYAQSRAAKQQQNISPTGETAGQGAPTKKRRLIYNKEDTYEKPKRIFNSVE